MTFDEFISHKGISWKAKGLAVAIVMNKKFFLDAASGNKINALVRMGNGASASIHNGLRELEAHEILTRKISRYSNEGNGMISGYSWQINICLPGTEEEEKGDK